MKFLLSIEGNDISELPLAIEELNRILTTRRPKKPDIKPQDPAGPTQTVQGIGKGSPLINLPKASEQQIHIPESVLANLPKQNPIDSGKESIELPKNSERTHASPRTSLGIPFRQNLGEKTNPVYRRIFRQCKKYKCTFSDLVRMGIVNENGDLNRDRTKPTSKQSDTRTNLLDPLTIAPGLKVRQTKKDSDRMTYGDMTVIARILGGSVIECRDAVGNIHKIAAQCLEIVQNETSAYAHQEASCV
jgi:hypothetical protein